MESAGIRVRRSVAEKRRIVELTYVPGQSVARVAQAEGVNSNQVFQWRRAYRAGEMEPTSTALLPVVVQAEGVWPADSHAVQMGDVPVHGSASKSAVQEQAPAASGSIHIELPGRATISVECGADRGLLQTVLESLRK